MAAFRHPFPLRRKAVACASSPWPMMPLGSPDCRHHRATGIT